jgi:Zn-dependent M28 family amino/carboxypeptidase
MRVFGLVAAILVFAFGSVYAGRGPETKAAKRWWKDVQYLADDRLEGRKPGSSGYDKAAAYVADELRSAGVRPAGNNGYYQPVDFRLRRLDYQQSAVTVVRSRDERNLQMGREVLLSPRSHNGLVEAEMVFAGHGLRIPEAGIDDLAGLDLRDKIVLVMRGAPKAVPGPLAAHSQSTAEQWRNLHAAGAVGLITLYNPAMAEMSWERYSANRAAPAIELADPALAENQGQAVSAMLGPEGAAELLKGTSHTLDSLVAASKAGGSLPRFAIPGALRVRASVATRRMTAPNVVGVKPGRGPDKDEFVLVSAHLDHLGVDPSRKEDPIFNGAMDNASGIGTLLEVARSLKGVKLNRSVLFAAVTAEENGLLGSKFFAENPTVPRQTIVANINLDMFLPIIPLRALTVYGVNESSLGDRFREEAKRYGIEVAQDPEPHRNIFIRSDQYSFIRKGIPALSVKFHADPGTPEFAAIKKWLAERYHAPSDDLNQPVDRAGAERFNEILGSFVATVANASERPAWKDSSFFRRYATPSAN